MFPTPGTEHAKKKRKKSPPLPHLRKPAAPAGQGRKALPATVPALAGTTNASAVLPHKHDDDAATTSSTSSNGDNL